MRMASHTAASVAGRPMMTDSASAAGSRPTDWIEAMSIGRPRSAASSRIAPTWPTNIATKMRRPHSAVPKNFQTRGA
jgi:hypothetical protein